MKRLSFLILFLCFIAPTIYGQSIDVVKDTTYFDQDWKKTIYLEDAKYARIVKRDNQNQIVGTVRDYYLPNWILQFEGKLSGENPDVPIGKCFWFFENGKIQSSATYVDGKPSSDAIQYKEDGTKIECKDTLIEIYPLTQTKLHSYYNTRSSRTVYTINVSTLKNVIVQHRIEDEGGNSLIDIGTSLMAMYSGGVSSALMAITKLTISKKVSTKNTFFITTSREVAQKFIDTKGTINNTGILHFSENTINETKGFIIPQDISYIYIGVQNNNYTTSAISAIEVVGIGKLCK